MLTMIFEEVGGRAIPRLPYDGAGEPRRADGATLFDLAQAARRFNESEEFLRTLWMSTFGEIVSLDDSPDSSSVLATPVNERQREIAPGLHRSRLELLHRAVYPNLEPDQFELFIEICRQRKLNPFCGQLRAQMLDRSNGQKELGIITTIAAFRLIAQRTGLWQGETKPLYCGPDEAWRELWPDDVAPFACEVSVRRKGVELPQPAIVYWKELAVYERRADGTVQLAEHCEKMKRLMLAKCCSAAAHRIAFAEELGGIYTFDEIGPRGVTPASNGGAGGSTQAAPDSDSQVRYEADDYSQLPAGAVGAR